MDIKSAHLTDKEIYQNEDEVHKLTFESKVLCKYSQSLCSVKSCFFKLGKLCTYLNMVNQQNWISSCVSSSAFLRRPQKCCGFLQKAELYTNQVANLRG